MFFFIVFNLFVSFLSLFNFILTYLTLILHFLKCCINKGIINIISIKLDFNIGAKYYD